MTRRDAACLMIGSGAQGLLDVLRPPPHGVFACGAMIAGVAFGLLALRRRSPRRVFPADAFRWATADE